MPCSLRSSPAILRQYQAATGSRWVAFINIKQFGLGALPDEKVNRPALAAVLTEHEVGDVQNLALLIVDPDGKGLRAEPLAKDRLLAIGRLHTSINSRAVKPAMAQTKPLAPIATSKLPLHQTDWKQPSTSRSSPVKRRSSRSRSLDQGEV
jgi:hypothetical protein